MEMNSLGFTLRRATERLLCLVFRKGLRHLQATEVLKVTIVT